MAHSSNRTDGLGFGAAAAALAAHASPSATGAVGGDQGMPNGGLPAAKYELLQRAVERFGVPVVLLAIVLWWARNDLVQPLLNAHFEFIGKITEAHNQHTNELRTIGDKLDELIHVSRNDK